MFPQYAQRQTEGEIAIWLLITVGALLIPIIVIGICCIRQHCWKTIPARRPQTSLHKINNNNELLTTKSTSWAQRVCDLFLKSPPIKLMKNQSRNTKIMSTKHTAALRSYNGPYMETCSDDRTFPAVTNRIEILSHTNSIKKQHVHLPEKSNISTGDDLRSIKDRQFTPRKQPFTGGDHFNTAMLTESPSNHRRVAVIPAPSSALSHLIQTAIIPAGSTVNNSNGSQILTPSKQRIFNSVDHNCLL